jgi:D-amino-acid dehydrogenase
MRRVKPIVAAANAYYPELKLEVPSPEKVWTGLRPCTPDGLPYLGKVPGLSNAIIAGGHAMIGVSMATGTGLLVSEMMEGQQTTIPVQAFRTDRF